MKRSFKLLTGFAGAIGLSLGIGFPAFAQVNPNPSVFQETPYAPTQRSLQQEVYVPVAGTPISIPEILNQSESFELLNALLPVAVLEDPALVSDLAGSRTYTLFAPTDRAFAALPRGIVSMLVLPQNRDLLVEILRYHIVPGAVTSRELATTEIRPLANGQPLAVRADEAAGSLMVDQARVIRPDIQASNGIIHAVDQVILPPDIIARLNTALPASGYSNQNMMQPFTNPAGTTTQPLNQPNIPIPNTNVNPVPGTQPVVPNTISPGTSTPRGPLNQPMGVPVPRR